MSVQVALENRVVTVLLEGPVSASDVATITRQLTDGVNQHREKVAVLAVLRGSIHLPGKEAKQAMRVHRDAIRSSVAEVHVVLEGTGLFGGLGGLLLGQASRWMRRGPAPAHFHRNEAQARRVLTEAGFL
jgi:hypothetical protein